MVSQLYLEPDKSVPSKPVADKSALFKKASVNPRAFVIKKITVPGFCFVFNLVYPVNPVQKYICSFLYFVVLIFAPFESLVFTMYPGRRA